MTLDIKTRPVVLISRCIQFDHCRWNGDMINSPFVERLKNHVDFISVCPESDIGLGVPRKPVRLALVSNEIRMLQHETGYDATNVMNTFSENFCRVLKPVDGIILKERSPSCGAGNAKIYDGPQDGAMSHQKGNGLFAAVCLSRFPQIPFTSEGHLFNQTLREHFYTRIYTLARFRCIRQKPSLKKLVEFHARHKLIFMGYNQVLMRKMGNIVANHAHKNPDEVFDEYFHLLCASLARLPRSASAINVFMHALGYFSEKVTGKEKRFFLDALEQYRSKKIPLSACTAIIKSWIVRFEEPYLGSQYFFAPYPEDLAELSDSGKG